MSGRGRGRNQGRGRSNTGRGRSFTNTGGRNSSNTTYKPSKKSLSDYVYYLGSAKQAADYETTTEFIINNIKKSFNFGNDIATSLEDLAEYNIEKHKPTLKVSKSTDDDEKDAENE